jgi:hypothetical protein
MLGGIKAQIIKEVGFKTLMDAIHHVPKERSRLEGWSN